MFFVFSGGMAPRPSPDRRCAQHEKRFQGDQLTTDFIQLFFSQLIDNEKVVPAGEN